MMLKMLGAAAASFLLSPVLALAAVPPTIGFSARIADNGRPVTGTQSFTFRLWNDPTASDTATNLVWTEGPRDIAVNDGVVATALGDTTTTPPGTALPAFTGAPLYLEVTMGTTSPFSPRLAIQSVPYAMRASVAESVPFGGVIGKTGNLVSAFFANRNAVTNGVTGFIPIATHTPAVNVSAVVFVRCSFDAGAAGVLLAFRAAVRSPPTTGTVVLGPSYEQATHTPGANLWVANTAIDGFDLNAGQTYEIGPAFISASPSGGFNNDFCTVNVATYQR